MKKISYLYLILTLPLVLFSCQTMQQRGTSVSREITGTPVLSEQQLTQYFMFKNPSADKKQVQRLARLYIQEGAYEGINSDVAFAQMCLETGYLTFGNLVVPELLRTWRNRCCAPGRMVCHRTDWSTCAYPASARIRYHGRRTAERNAR